MTRSRWILRRGSREEFDALTAGAAIDPPIEQTAEWAEFEESDEDRQALGVFVVEDSAECPRAVFRATRINDHGTHFVWLRHGPVWLGDPSAEEERELVDALVNDMKIIDAGATHIRLDLRFPAEVTILPASMITYDRTVVVDTSISSRDLEHDAAAEEILSRFKSRGRRDVRKSIRESGLVCADETERAREDFEEYHAVMRETAERDGFSPWPKATYERMIRILGPNRARVYAGRIEGELVCWAIVTISGARGWYFYAASKSAVSRRLVADRLLLFFCAELALAGVEQVDLMGIGSDVAPGLMSLNTFKTKFSPEIKEVPAAREIVVRPWLYSSVSRARRLVRSLRR